jgi:hypothetical protein
VVGRAIDRQSNTKTLKDLKRARVRLTRSDEEERHMHSVEVRLPTHNLSKALVSMREWLDGMGYAVFRYDCEDEGSEVVVRVGFRDDKQAEEFAKELEGVVLTASTSQAGL